MCFANVAGMGQNIGGYIFYTHYTQILSVGTRDHGIPLANLNNKAPRMKLSGLTALV